MKTQQVLIIKGIALLLFLLFAIAIYVRMNTLLNRMDILLDKTEASSFLTEISVDGKEETKRVFLVAPVQPQ